MGFLNNHLAPIGGAFCHFCKSSVLMSHLSPGWGLGYLKSSSTSRSVDVTQFLEGNKIRCSTLEVNTLMGRDKEDRLLELKFRLRTKEFS